MSPAIDGTITFYFDTSSNGGPYAFAPDWARRNTTKTALVQGFTL